LARIAKSATIINALRGDHLYGAGDASRGLYVVISGRIIVSVSISAGVSKVTEIVGAGGNLGLAAAVLACRMLRPQVP
jgi:CRP-like cAMP-binding protein